MAVTRRARGQPPTCCPQLCVCADCAEVCEVCAPLLVPVNMVDPLCVERADAGERTRAARWDVRPGWGGGVGV